MENYWILLLDDCVKRKKTGYSLPFLIGAPKVIDKDLISIKDLIESMVSNNLKKVVVKYCLTYKEFMFSTNPNLLFGSNSGYLSFGNLIIIPTDGLKGITELEHIIEVLTLDSHKYILKQEFSKKINGNRGYFDGDEERIIKKLLK